VSAPHVGPHGRTVAANIHRLRQARGLTQHATVTALAAAGRPIPRSALSDIELGVRRVDIDDLHALAVVLGVSPLRLLTAPDCATCQDVPRAMTACLACGAEGPR
jgi:transcriptional regulator with XRE-family HTH domain